MKGFAFVLYTHLSAYCSIENKQPNDLIELRDTGINKLKKGNSVFFYSIEEFSE